MQAQQTALEKSVTMRAAAAEQLRLEKQATRMAAVLAWVTRFPDVMDWVDKNMESNTFAASMAEYLDQKGELTERQIAAVRAIIARGAPASTEIDVSKIAASFAKASARGIKKPAMRLETFKFKSAGDTGANPGAIYVTEEGEYLGKITGGAFRKVRECTPDQEARIVAAASNPEAAAEAYGRRTGRCCICGLELTAAESIERMIGPICADKYF